MTYFKFGFLIVAIDSNIGGSALEWSSDPSTFASEFEAVMEHETTIGVTNGIDDIVTRSSRLDVCVGFVDSA